jgi:hypothetical protein
MTFQPLKMRAISLQWRTQDFFTGGTGFTPGIFSVGGVVGFQQMQLRTEDRENGDLGAVAP